MTLLCIIFLARQTFHVFKTNVLVDISYEQGQCFVEQDVPSDVLHSSKRINIFQNFSKFISTNEIPMQGPV